MIIHQRISKSWRRSLYVERRGWPRCASILSCLAMTPHAQVGAAHFHSCTSRPRLCLCMKAIQRRLVKRYSRALRNAIRFFLDLGGWKLQAWPSNQLRSLVFITWVHMEFLIDQCAMTGFASVRVGPVRPIQTEYSRGGQAHTLRFGEVAIRGRGARPRGSTALETSFDFEVEECMSESQFVRALCHGASRANIVPNLFRQGFRHHGRQKCVLSLPRIGVVVFK